MFRVARHPAALFAFLACLLIGTPVDAWSGEENFIRPPTRYSYSLMKKWVERTRKEIAPQIPSIDLVDTPEWSDYVNNHHFVPLSCDGVPEGFVVDFNWDGHKGSANDHRKLPTGEMTDEGKFLLWWDFCNFREYSRRECKDFIRWIVSHERGHHTQWLHLAVAAQVKARDASTGGEFPKQIGQITSNAADEFKKRWNNCAHYQCREVEVYAAQIASGEMSREMANARLGMLNEYDVGCRSSQWTEEFYPALDRAGAILDWFKYPRGGTVNPFAN